MARARRTSAILETARQRLNGLTSIDPTPNLGPNLTPASFESGLSVIRRMSLAMKVRCRPMNNNQTTSRSVRSARRMLVAAFMIVTPGLVAAQTNTFPSSGNVGVGTTTPTYSLDVNGGVNAFRAKASTTNSNDTIATFENSAGITAIIRANGNVGIGTTSPNAKLHIISSDDTVAPAISIRQDSNAAYGFDFLLDTNVNGNLFVNRVNNGTSANVMTFDRAGGNVGIGTTDFTDAIVGTSKFKIVDGSSIFNFKDLSSGQGYADISNGTMTGIISHLNTSEGVVFGSASNHNVSLRTNNTAKVTIATSGNVGIGTTSPTAKLHVSGSGNVMGAIQSTTAGAEIDVISSAANYGSWGLGTGWSSAPGGVRSFYVYDNVASATRMTVDSSGNVGIGVTTPNSQYKLDVAGNINSSATITGNNIVAKYQDVAEWVPSSEQLAAGTVVVLDTTKSNQVTSSSVSYDTRVAGVISEQPGITLGERSDNKVLVATTGRVRVKVDATKSSIHIGDLLVTSDIPGVAMKSEPIIIQGRQIHAPGTLIGKALEPLAKGQGEILVLLSLQ
jgi:hypothetical protein